LEQSVDNPDFTTSPISEPVANTLVSRLEELSELELLEMWKKFSYAGGMTGPIFEAYVHHKFRKQIKFKASPMKRVGQPKSRWHASFSSRIPKGAKASAKDFNLAIEGHETVVYGANLLKVDENKYYIPASGQQVGLDSFIVLEGTMYICQCTGGKTHGIKDGMADFLQGCEGIPNTDCWRFIFVVPGDLESFSCPASRNKIIGGLNLYTAKIHM